MNHLLAEFDLGLLLTFDALLKDKNVTHAAARLSNTQSVLSARLMRLRQLLGDPLFIPSASGRGMVASSHALALQPELSGCWTNSVPSSAPPKCSIRRPTTPSRSWRLISSPRLD